MLLLAATHEILGDLIEQVKTADALLAEVIAGSEFWCQQDCERLASIAVRIIDACDSVEAEPDGLAFADFLRAASRHLQLILQNVDMACVSGKGGGIPSAALTGLTALLAGARDSLEDLQVSVAYITPDDLSPSHPDAELFEAVFESQQLRMILRDIAASLIPRADLLSSFQVDVPDVVLERLENVETAVVPMEDRFILTAAVNRQLAETDAAVADLCERSNWRARHMPRDEED